MVELLAAMVVMSLIMIPLFGILKASLRIAESSSQRQDGSFTRHAALEAMSRQLQGSAQVLELKDQSLVVLRADGGKLRFSLQGTQLVMESDLGSQVLIDGLAKLRFYEVGTPASATAGRLIAIDVVTQGTKPPFTSVSSNAQVWIRPAI